MAGEEVPADPLAGHLPGDVLDAVLADVQVQTLAVIRPCAPRAVESAVLMVHPLDRPWPASGSRLCANTLATLRAAPQPAEGGDSPPGRSHRRRSGPAPLRGVRAAPCPSRSPAIGVSSSVTGMPFVCVRRGCRARRRSALLWYVVELVGVGAGSAGFALIEAEIPSMSELSSSKSNSSKLDLIRSGDTDFGNTMSPRWMCQRNTTCAGDLPTASAIRSIAGSSSTLP